MPDRRYNIVTEICQLDIYIWLKARIFPGEYYFTESIEPLNQGCVLFLPFQLVLIEWTITMMNIQLIVTILPHIKFPK